MKLFRVTYFQTLLVFIFFSTAVTGCTAETIVAAPVQADASAGVTIYAAGDIAKCDGSDVANSGAAKTAALIAAALVSDKNAAVLTLGDNTYPDGLPKEFSSCYGPTWGQFKDRTYPSPGNHDYNTPGATGYYEYFGDRAGPARRGYYSVDVGKWHLVSLNSNLNEKEAKAQLDWLMGDLGQHKATCTLAYWHHPLYSSGGHGNNKVMRAVWEILHAAGADLVLVGHDHDYERFAPQDAQGNRDDKRGIREFVVGTGGASLTMVGWRKAHSEVSGNADFGVLKLILRDRSYDWQFMSVSGDTSGDHGTGQCH